MEGSCTCQLKKNCDRGKKLEPSPVACGHQVYAWCPFLFLLLVETCYRVFFRLVQQLLLGIMLFLPELRIPAVPDGTHGRCINIGRRSFEYDQGVVTNNRASNAEPFEDENLVKIMIFQTLAHLDQQVELWCTIRGFKPYVGLGWSGYHKPGCHSPSLGYTDEGFSF